MSRFYTNESRLADLRITLRRDRPAFEKQAWEGIKTGVFGIDEFREVVRMATAPSITVNQIDCPRCGYQEGLP